MSPYVLPVVFIALVYTAIIGLNERYHLLSSDRFPSTAAKLGAYAWLGLFLFSIVFLVTAAALKTPTAKEIAATPFYRIFGLHWILIIFLAVWWLLSGRPRLSEYLSIRAEGAGEMTMSGFAIGFGGWIFTIIVAVAIGAILSASGLMPKNPQPSPMIGFMASLAIWKKIVIVLSAMTVEEFFFRAWLQKRLGLLASTILFAIAHSGLGQPLLLIGVFVVSLVIGLTFFRTKNLIPCMIAHGVFDGIQLFVILPIAFRMMGMQ